MKPALILILTLFFAIPVCPQASAGQSTTGPADAPSFVTEATINAPVAAVWSVWTSGDGYKALGVAKAEVDLRVGGLIRSHYDAKGVLGDEETIENRILAYEPPRMIAIQIARPPKSFPFKEAWKKPWTVITLTDLGNNRTLVRVASMGFGMDKESIAMQHFFEVGDADTLKVLQAHFDSSPTAGKLRQRSGRALLANSAR